jgi:hypothetical protein
MEREDVDATLVEMVAPLKEEEGANALVDARIARRVAKVFILVIVWFEDQLEFMKRGGIVL